MRALADVLPLLTSSLLLVSCAVYESELQSGQRAFEDSEYERALATFRALEPDMSRLSVLGRAHYAYLRGMTDYRIGYKSDARHWLAIASALDQKTPGALPPDWEQRMSDSLNELNEEVYGEIGALEKAPLATDSAAGKSDAAPDADTAALPAQAEP